ncbi:Zn-ribbon domain-containing OB-fold protein [Amycolatopsis sp. cg13]|uniref:Zn-ribbon domain-containing OB-fold protein n=1 Tax=Amycolatopsis sp. cg13 TaxID=3238807 RepID=UPI003524041E
MTETPDAWPAIQRDTKSAPFFDAAARDELVIKRCTGCGQALPPEALVCTTCAGTALDWIPAEGSGTLLTWTTVHRAPNRAYTDLVPYTVGIVELSEGPWLYARVDTARPSPDLPLRAEFVHPGDGESYPVFTAAE